MCRNKNELRSAVAKYRSLKSRKAEIERELAEVQADIFDYLEIHDVAPKEQVTGPNFIVSYSVCSTSSFDKGALQAVLGDDLTPFQKYSEYNRLYVR